MQNNEHGLIRIIKQTLRVKFTLKELSSAFGDWGTLIPFIIGYVSIVGFNPGSLILCLGNTNVVLGIRFNLPFQLNPKRRLFP
jgi:hypothetical protein